MYSICCDIRTSTASEYICATNCGHIFHDECLKVWLSRSETCPHCRTELREEDCIRLFMNSQQSAKPVTVAELLTPDEDIMRKFHRIAEVAKVANAAVQLPSPGMIRLHGKMKFMKIILNAKTASTDLLKMCHIVRYKILKKEYDGDNVANTLCQVKDIPENLKSITELEERILSWNKLLMELEKQVEKIQAGTRIPHPTRPYILRTTRKRT